MTEGARPTLGHVHLKVRHLERAIEFYRKLLGLEVTERVGETFAFLSGDERHHELALQELGESAAPPPAHATGLYHTAWEVPDREAFRLAWERLRTASVPVSGVDHGISWALYFRDPDGNGVEIYVDRRNAEDGTSEWRGMTRPLTPSQIEGRPADGG